MNRHPIQDTLSYLGSGGMVAGGGLLAQAQDAAQTFYGSVAIVFGFLTFATPYVTKVWQARLDAKGYQKRIEELTRELAAMKTGQVEPNAVHIAAMEGKLSAIRDELTRQGYLKPARSSDDIPILLPALLVEDDPATAELMTKVLVTAHYDVKVAATLKDALAVLCEKPFDLVILDLGLPDGDGLEVVREARRCELAARFIVTTGQTHPARLDAVASQLRHEDRLLIKPLDFHDLVESVVPRRPVRPRSRTAPESRS